MSIFLHIYLNTRHPLALCSLKIELPSDPKICEANVCVCEEVSFLQLQIDLFGIWLQQVPVNQLVEVGVDVGLAAVLAVRQSRRSDARQGGRDGIGGETREMLTDAASSEYETS
jgi:hypothetical protein